MKPMSHVEYRKALDRVGLSNRGFCQLLGVDERTGRRWADADEEAEIPGSVVALLRVAVACKLDAEKFRELIG